MDRIYLDNASTTKVDKRVIEAMMPFLGSVYGNASSVHAFGKTAKVMLEDARDLIASSIGAASSEIFFTSGGTESNNFAIKGIAYRFLGGKKNHIISSQTEHSAVLDTLKWLEKQFGVEVTYLRPAEGGAIDPQSVRNAIRKDTFLIALMHSNNETGAITDIRSVSEIAREHDVILHCDTVQSFGKTNCNVKELGSNTAIISAHKIFGPKGISALCISKGTPVEKFIHGGMQERDMRGGTENIPAVAGFMKAVEIAMLSSDEDQKHYLHLRQTLAAMLRVVFGDAVKFNSPVETGNTLPNILNFSFDRDLVSFDEEVLLIKLDLDGIAVSGGSACTSGTQKPSHVLLALGKDPREALGSVRASFGRDNVIEDIENLAASLSKIILRK